jgi:hypothetical protein
MDRYTARMNLHGTTQRERMKNRLINNINNKSSGSLSYKDVLLNGEETQLMINTGTKPYYKEFQSLPNQKIVMGDYVEWSNRTWLVYEADADDEFYIDGKMYECNYVLYWQNNKGDVIRKPCFVQNASSYNNGEEDGKVITLASNQFMVWMPLDDDTIILRNGKRMFIDNYKDAPSCYKLTRPDTVSMKFGEKGCTYYIFTQTETNVESDKLVTLDDGMEVWLADYVEVDDIEEDPTTPPENPDEMTDLRVVISGKKNLKVGFSRTYTALFTDVDGNAIEWDNTYAWNVVSDFEVGQETDGNTIKLLVEDEDCVDSLILLQVIRNNSVIAEIEITVIEMW